MDAGCSEHCSTFTHQDIVWTLMASNQPNIQTHFLLETISVHQSPAQNSRSSLLWPSLNGVFVWSHAAAPLSLVSPCGEPPAPEAGKILIFLYPTRGAFGTAQSPVAMTNNNESTAKQRRHASRRYRLSQSRAGYASSRYLHSWINSCQPIHF